MPIHTNCPSCSRVLRVPDDLIGKNVKCPSCSTIFIATDIGALPPPLPAAPDDAFRDSPGAEPPHGEETYREEPKSGRAGAPQLPPPPEEDYDDDELEQDEDRRRRRGRLERARARVSGPATALQVVGGLALAFAILSLVLNLAFVGAGAGRGAGPGFRGGPANPALQMMQGVIGAAFGLVWSSLILYGASEMKKLRNYGMAMTATIIAMLPCSGCCILGLPFGIWAIIVLNDADVKASFK